MTFHLSFKIENNPYLFTNYSFYDSNVNLDLQAKQVELY